MAITITTNTPDGIVSESVDTLEIKTAVNDNQEDKNAKLENDSETSTESANVPNKKDKSNTEDDLDYLNKDEEDESEEDTESDEEEDDEEDTEEDDSPKNKKSGFKKRIDKLTKQKSDLEVRLANLEAKLNKNSDKEEENKPAPKEDTDLKEPDFEDYDTVAEYAKAISKYNLELYKKEQAEQSAQSKVEAESQKILGNWKEKVEVAKTKYKDWANIEKSDVPLTHDMRSSILSSDIGTDIVYYLYKNPAKALEIAQMAPAQQHKMLGKIEAKLEGVFASRNTDDKDKVKTTNAPSPVKPITSQKSSKTGAVKNPDDMTQEEYEVWFNKNYGKK